MIYFGRIIPEIVANKPWWFLGRSTLCPSFGEKHAPRGWKGRYMAPQTSKNVGQHRRILHVALSENIWYLIRYLKIHKFMIMILKGKGAFGATPGSQTHTHLMKMISHVEPANLDVSKEPPSAEILHTWGFSLKWGYPEDGRFHGESHRSKWMMIFWATPMTQDMRQITNSMARKCLSECLGPAKSPKFYSKKMVIQRFMIGISVPLQLWRETTKKIPCWTWQTVNYWNVHPRPRKRWKTVELCPSFWSPHDQPPGFAEQENHHSFER